MTDADWRALIEAYLDGRLSADGFARRFNESWIAQLNARQPLPGPIQILFSAVEQFSESDAMGEDGDDDDMRQAARRALNELDAAPNVTAAHTFDRTRAREEMRRFQIQMSGCAGIGCAIALIWVGLCVLQVYFVVEWVNGELGWGALPSTIVGIFLAFVPIIGNVLAFMGWTAKGLPTLVGAILFFAAPAATLLSAWYRWRRFGR